MVLNGIFTSVVYLVCFLIPLGSVSFGNLGSVSALFTTVILVLAQCLAHRYFLNIT